MSDPFVAFTLAALVAGMFLVALMLWAVRGWIHETHKIVERLRKRVIDLEATRTGQAAAPVHDASRAEGES